MSDIEAQPIVLNAHQIRENLLAPFDPSETKKRKGGGGRMFDYISGETAITRLIESTNTFSTRIVTIEEVEIVRNNQVMRCDRCIMEMTIPELGTRVGMGVQVREDNAGEDTLKGALTDAFKNCAKQFGVYLYAYRDDDTSAGTPGQGQPHGGGQVSGGGNPASEAQRKYFRDLAQQVDLTPGQLREDLNWPAGTTADTLTKQQASDGIRYLREYLGLPND